MNNSSINEIYIKAPRLADSVMLVPDFLLRKDNIINVDHGKFYMPYRVTGVKARMWPIHEMVMPQGITVNHRAIPITSLRNATLQTRWKGDQ